MIDDFILREFKD